MIFAEWCLQDLRRICRICASLHTLCSPNSSNNGSYQGISFDTNAVVIPYKIMYLLTGALAITVGLAVLLWMPDSPRHAGFLSKKERVIALERVRDDQGGTENKTIKKAQLAEALTDVRSWLVVLLVVMSTFRCSGAC